MFYILHADHARRFLLGVDVRTYFTVAGPWGFAPIPSSLLLLLWRLRSLPKFGFLCLIWQWLYEPAEPVIVVQTSCDHRKAINKVRATTALVGLNVVTFESVGKGDSAIRVFSVQGYINGLGTVYALNKRIDV